ncbi:glycosyltransferase [Nonlabens sp.]|uniref:glycosyltransferase family 2 protein n=1 Tax=Nonlabens sp. TaxID=1888209 RepID=UPI001BCC8CE8|nr:glycosyltransferase [Nonlabens sp.]
MSNYKNTDLEILIATMNRSDLSFLEMMFQQPLAAIQASILIVNQSTKTVLQSPYEHIRVLNSPYFGLSKSRNLAMNHAVKPLCWLLDDDCVVLNNSIDEVISAYNLYDYDVLTFKTQTLEENDFYNYEDQFKNHNKKSIIPILSPEITFNRKSILIAGLKFDTRFGLGAQFQDSENYVFLDSALKKKLQIGFVPQTIVQHPATTSSDDVASNRVIYARGAIAGRRNIITAAFYQFKYVFFLWRNGHVKSFVELWEKFMVFQHGANDYLSGFEGHRINHPKQ